MNILIEVGEPWDFVEYNDSIEVSGTIVTGSEKGMFAKTMGFYAERGGVAMKGMRLRDRYKSSPWQEMFNELERGEVLTCNALAMINGSEVDESSLYLDWSEIKTFIGFIVSVRKVTSSSIEREGELTNVDD